MGRRARILVIAGAVVLVVALVATLVAVLGSEPHLTYAGESIDQPERTLTQAEANLRDIVEQRHGAIDDDTRCYFSLREQGESSDVQDHLRCGPVLFVDGDPAEPYLTFPLERRGGEDDPVRLVAADEPEDPQPTRLGANEDLQRPDDQSPPDGSGGLEPPPPPRAEPGLLEQNPLDQVDLDDPGPDARIGSFNVDYTLTGIAQPDRVGRGDEARRPAGGERFVAAELEVGAGVGGDLVGTADVEATIQIDDADPVPVPGSMAEPLQSGGLLISVPEDAESVNLVVNDAGVEQKLSLLTGEPGGNNVAVLRRDNLGQDVSFSGDLTFTASAPGYIPEAASVHVVVERVDLVWFMPDDASRHPEDPTKAWLVPTINYTWSAGFDLGPDTGIDPEYWSLSLPNGRSVHATNLSSDPNRFLLAFGVPANFTQGTLTVGGSRTSGGFTIDFGASRLQIPVDVPAG